MKSTLLNMTSVLLGITLIASAGVGAVNLITAEPIAKAKEAARIAALEQVLPAFESTEPQQMEIDGLSITVFTARSGEQTTGYAVETLSDKGFSGTIRLMVGFTPDGKIYNVNVLEQKETPGLGTKMTDEGNPLLASVQHKDLTTMKLVGGQLAVRKDGGDVDALTAATISSRAWVDAINRAYMAYLSVAQGTQPTDTASGATATAQSADAQEGGENE